MCVVVCDEHTQHAGLDQDGVMTGGVACEWATITVTKSMCLQTHHNVFVLCRQGFHSQWWDVTNHMAFWTTWRRAWLFFMTNPDFASAYGKHRVHRWAATVFSWPLRDTYPAPAAFWGLLLWNSISSTVHTAPFTFSSRTKHLWRLRLCLTAF